MEMRDLRPAEKEAFLELMEAAFDERGHFARYFEFDERLGASDTKVICDDGRLVAGLQIFTRRVRLGGEVVWLGGIGSVATHPDYERRGLASRLLRSAIMEMQEREMPLSLLFTGRTSFYERLGWVQIPYPVWVCGDPRVATLGQTRSMRKGDLTAIQELYEKYCCRLDGTTVRDPVYWRGQLRFAGTPDEDIRVAEREGRVVAYVRVIFLDGITRAMEYAREDDAADELARLLADATPEEKPLFVSDAGDLGLEEACRVYFADFRSLEFPDQMWRVVDRARLERLVPGSGEWPDAELLVRLVGGKSSVFWPTDRF